jgi:hypothetical protein
MANYIKSFNFRNGVQVDNNHFIVNANGLVGIGSTIPTQVLDVVGNINVSGFVTAPNLYTTLLSAPAASITTVTAGVVTANYFYGDGQNIINIPTSQWTNINVGLGFTSIYARGYVGIATVDPRFTLQVGGNPNNSQSGVGINSTGSILATGIITASSFSGSGSSITNINASNINAGTLGNSYLPSSISVSGIITASQFSGNLVGNVLGNVSGFSGGLNGTPSITVSNIQASNYNSSGILTSTTINATSIVTTNINSGFSTTGISTVYTLLNVPASASIGIGTAVANANIHIYPPTTPSLQLTSGGNYESYISIGRSFSRTGNNSEIRFGNTSGLYSYSTTGSLDIINYGLGNINQYLQLGSAGVGTGSFNWFYGQVPNTSLMTLTYGGNLGIGITLPTNNLHVVGTSTVTGNSYIGGNLSVSNNLTVNGSLIANGGISNVSISGTFTGSLLGNVYATTGISTFNQIKSTSTASFSGNVGIGTTALTYPLQVNTGSNSFIVNSFGAIGVGTTAIVVAGNNTILVDSSQGLGIFQGVGIGTTNPRCYADFSDAGTSGPNVLAAGRFMLPPRLTTSQRNSLSTVEGGLIYNTTLHRLELYNGTSWVGIATIA